MSTRPIHTQKGFTLIEVMIAMAIFTVVVTIGIGAVLDSMVQHKRSENIRSVMDSLNFIMEDMARNLRLGSNIRCVTDPAEMTSGAYTTPGDPYSPVIAQSCPLRSSQIVFNNLYGEHLRYIISLPTAPIPNQIMKSLSDVPPDFITPPEVQIDPVLSGFTVRGAESSTSGGDLSQPSVVIRLAGTVTHKNVVSRFAIQTTVGIRALDS